MIEDQKSIKQNVNKLKEVQKAINQNINETNNMLKIFLKTHGISVKTNKKIYKKFQRRK